MYWSTLTLTTIGETPKPERDIEYLFQVKFIISNLSHFRKNGFPDVITANIKTRKANLSYIQACMR